MSEKKVVEDILINDVVSLKKDIESISNFKSSSFQLIEYNPGTPDLQYHDNINNINIKEDTLPLNRLTLLHIAAYYNSYDCFRYLEEKFGEGSLRSLSADEFYPLHYSCFNTSIEISLYILTKDPIQSRYHKQDSKIQLLYCAVIGGEPEVLRALLDSGANLDDRYNDHKSLISKAIRSQNKEILTMLMKSTSIQNNLRIDTKQITPAMNAVISHNPEALEIIFSGEQDLLASFTDKYGYHSLISLICLTDSTKHMFKNVLLKILKENKDVQIEPKDQNEAGVCHWCCMYFDMDVAEAMFNTPNINVNRFDKNSRLGPAAMCDIRLSKSGEKKVISMLNFLIAKGLNVNLKQGNDKPTLLESFITAVNKNYSAIKFLIDEAGADVNATVSFLKDNKKMTLIEFVESKRNKKMFEAFGLKY